MANYLCHQFLHTVKRNINRQKSNRYYPVIHWNYFGHLERFCSYRISIGKFCRFHALHFSYSLLWIIQCIKQNKRQGPMVQYDHLLHFNSNFIRHILPHDPSTAYTIARAMFRYFMSWNLYRCHRYCYLGNCLTGQRSFFHCQPGLCYPDCFDVSVCNFLKREDRCLFCFGTCSDLRWIFLSKKEKPYVCSVVTLNIRKVLIC